MKIFRLSRPSPPVGAPPSPLARPIGWCLLLLLGIPAPGQAPSPVTDTGSPVPVFRKGEDGYACFRIPAIVRAPDGALLAFAEGRVADCNDFGDVDIVVKASRDDGRTWGPLRVAVSFGMRQAGNPAPVYDRTDAAFPAGRLFLFYNTATADERDIRGGHTHRKVWYVTSPDQGLSWSEPVDITAQVRPDTADWRWYANTPGHALQLPTGRLLIAANHSAGPPQDRFREYRAHAFFSDDHGRTFRWSADVPFPGSNESSAACLPDGGVLMSIRDQSKTRPYRLLATSMSGGESWDSVRYAPDLPDPVCQGSLLNFEGKNGRMSWLHANAAHPDERCCLTVKWSRDAGRTWEAWQYIYPGSAAYSDLVQLSPARAGILFERDGYSEIAFVSFPGPPEE